MEEAIRHGGARDTMKQLGDLMHHTGGTDHMQPTRMTTMPRRRRSRRSPGGAASEDLLSFQQGGFWDDNKGGWLSPELVRKARAEEMAYVRWHDVYQRVPRSQCFSDTGKAPIRTGSADANKGAGDMPNVRSRWVAKEFRTHASPKLFAPTSPLEGVKLVISKAASTGSSDTVLLIVDVRRAYFYAPAKRRVYIELPEEDYRYGDEEKCGMLNVSLYGTRDAASNWEAELEGFLEGIGFKKGSGSSCLLNGEAMDASGAGVPAVGNSGWEAWVGGWGGRCGRSGRHSAPRPRRGGGAGGIRRPLSPHSSAANGRRRGGRQRAYPSTTSASCVAAKTAGMQGSVARTRQ